MKRIPLKEDLARSTSPLRVDRDAGIIYGVKVLGWDSDNGRRYLPEAGRAAIGLYEGAKVFLDHPAKKDNGPRSDADAFGRLHAVHWTTEGVFGDLHFYTSHPMAERVCEDAEKIDSLGVFGLSHNAQGEGETVDGIFVIHRIVEVRSVDLVSEPATVRNLKESRRMQALEANDKLTADDHVLNAMKACKESDMSADEKYRTIAAYHDIFNPKPEKGDEEDDDKDKQRQTEARRRVASGNLTEALTFTQEHMDYMFGDGPMPKDVKRRLQEGRRRNAPVQEARTKARDEYLGSLTAEERLRYMMN